MNRQRECEEEGTKAKKKAEGTYNFRIDKEEKAGEVTCEKLGEITKVDNEV